MAADPRPADHSGGGPSGQAGEAAPACTLEGITQDCAAFDPEKVGRKITLPDGTFIPNFAYKPWKHDKREDGKEDDFVRRDREQSEAEEKSLQVREKLSELLNGLGKAKVSLRFALAVTDSGGSPGQLEDIWMRWVKTPPDPEDDGAYLRLPFPPEDAKAVPKYVTFKEVRDWLDKNLGAEQDNVRKALKASEDAGKKARDKESTDQDRKDRELLPERVTRVNALFEIAKEKVSKLFETRLADSKLTAEAKTDLQNAVAKVKRLKFRAPTHPKVVGNPNCQAPIPNAWYEPSSMTVSLCPAFYNYPDTTLMEILGHEIGHSVDPCNSQCPVCSIDKDKLEKKANPTLERGTLPTYPPLEEIMLTSALQRALESGTETAQPLEVNHPASLIRTFEKEGILRTEVPGTPVGRYPLKDVYDCLSSEKGGGFRKYEESEMKEAARELAAQRAGEKVGSKDPAWRAKEEKRLSAILTRFPECMGLNKNSHMGEATADWIGSRVLGSFLQDEAKKGNKLDTPAKRIAAIGFSASLVCAQHFSEKENTDEEKEDVSSILGDYRGLGDPHPGSKARVEKITLRDKLIRMAMGCDPNDDECGKKWGIGT